MHFGTVNVYAVMAAAAASVALGYAWYSEFLFKRYWIKSMGRMSRAFGRARKKADPGVEFVLSFLTSVVMAVILARLIALTGTAGVIGGLVISLYIWTGFVVIVLGSLVFHEGRHADYFFISAGYRLLELLTMGAIIGSLA